MPFFPDNRSAPTLKGLLLKRTSWAALALFFSVTTANEWIGSPEQDFASRTQSLLVKAARFNRDLDRVQGILAHANQNIVDHLVENTNYAPGQLAQARTSLLTALSDAESESLSRETASSQFDEIQTRSNSWFSASRAILSRAGAPQTTVHLDDPDVVEASGMLDSLQGLCADLRLTEDTLLATEASHNPTPSIALRLSLEFLLFVLLCTAYASRELSAQRKVADLQAGLQENSAYLTLFHDLPLPVLLFEESNHAILSANRAAEAKYGYELDELQQLTLSALRDPSESARSLEWWATSDYRAGEPLDGGKWTHRRKDGTRFIVWTHVVRATIGERSVALLVVTDVSGQEGREALLEEVNATLVGVLDSLPLSIAWKDRNLKPLGGNRAFVQSAGSQDSALLADASLAGLGVLNSRSAVNDEKVLEGLIALRNVEEVHPVNADLWISRSQLPLRSPTGEIVGVVDAFEDITLRKRSELAMRLRLRALDASVNAILIVRATPAGNVIEYTNPAFARMTGYSTREVVGRDFDFLDADDTGQRGVEQVATAMREGVEVAAVMRKYRKDGSRFWCKLYIAPIRELGGSPTHYVGVLTDVTELIQYQEQLERQANFDTLTQLPNRSLLQTRLVAAIQAARANHTSVAVLFLDLDLFKHVNDSLGHGVGDRLLQHISERLVNCVRDTDTVARYGGDEFVMILPHPEGVDLPALLTRILAAISEPVFVNEHELYVEASIGVSRYPADGDTPETMLKKADAAMYLAKERGRNSFEFYHTELDAEVNERLALSNSLRRAVRAGELEVHYQPQVDMRTGRILGAEALLRWNDPELGMVPPSTFIPLAEESGLIVKMGEFVLREACKQLVAWKAQGLPTLRMSVNLSPQQLARSNVLSMVETVLVETGACPTHLELEMTESTLMSNVQETTRLLNSLQELGLHIAIDDFGTGYSSLSYLKKFKVDRIKIDRAFVRDIGQDGDDEIITRAVIALASTLDIQVIAEGVETERQRDFLLRHGCVEGQGFLYSRAVQPEVFALKLRQGGVPAPASMQEA